MTRIRIIFMADTHLGFDLPFRPRVERRRRGPDFFANFRSVIDSAITGRADAIIHGGDLFYRSRIPKRLSEMVFDPIKTAARNGIPFFIIPGNHERSFIPHSEFSFHPNIHIFTRPATFYRTIRGVSLGVSGFPFVRENIRGRLRPLTEQTQWQQRRNADCRLLCMHQSVDGAIVGPSDYMFRSGRDVADPRHIPSAFAAVLSGHIHRHQVITRDLAGRPLKQPVLYPGAIERVSFAERMEEKGYLELEIQAPVCDGRPKLSWKFIPLPARPMFDLDLCLRSASANLDLHLARRFEQLPEDAIVRLNIHGGACEKNHALPNAPSIRNLAGPGINVSIRYRYPPKGMTGISGKQYDNVEFLLNSRAG